MTATRRIVLIDPDANARTLLASRLAAQGFVVDPAPDAARGAENALAAPPAAVVANLWMPGISGVQLCRLLRAEPATADVPVVLRSTADDPRSRFWAERAGAAALVSHGRVGELVRVLRGLTQSAPSDDGFFMHLGAGAFDIRDRIAEHLDAALFDSVVAAEVRSLASACSFETLFDALSQLSARLVTYRWLAMKTTAPARFAIHAHPDGAARAEREAIEALAAPANGPVVSIQDQDASSDDTDAPAVVRDIRFAGGVVGSIAVAPAAGTPDPEIAQVVSLLASELGGAIRMATLVEEQQRLATTDALTGLLNRRGFVAAMESELARASRTGSPLSVVLCDLDHFKSINDRFGHAAGDAVLAATGAVVTRTRRSYDVFARWGGEEIVGLLPGAATDGAAAFAERLRKELASATIALPSGQTVSFTASIGVACITPGDTIDSLIDRADRAMYVAKTTGRNRISVDGESSVVACAA